MYVKPVMFTPLTLAVKVYGEPITRLGVLILITTSDLLTLNVLVALPALWVALPANVAVTVYVPAVILTVSCWMSFTLIINSEL